MRTSRGLVQPLRDFCACPPKPVTDDAGRAAPEGLCEKRFLDINGARQGMFLRSRHAANPVLLYVHGGLPEYFLTERHPTPLENHFTVAWWDQRGAGLSYDPSSAHAPITTQQAVLDTVAVTHYLRERFGQQRIYLMAHSGGSFLGLQAVAQHPDLYTAYIGMAQMVDQLRSETLAYEYMLAEYRRRNDRRMLNRLLANPVTATRGTPRGYLALRDKAMHQLGVGTTHDMRSVITGVFLPSLASRQYTPTEKLRLWRGKLESGVSPLWNDMLRTDLAEQVPALDVPVYFLHGVHDYTCSYELARNYASRLQAPVKGFYTFPNSAHSPILEEPDKASRIMREDMLNGTTDLADH